MGEGGGHPAKGRCTECKLAKSYGRIFNENRSVTFIDSKSRAYSMTHSIGSTLCHAACFKLMTVSRSLLLMPYENAGCKACLGRT